jgi:hypothetical protein
MTATAEIARLGEDDRADLRLGPGAGAPWLAVTHGAAIDAAAPGLAGYLLTATFWRQPLAAVPDGAARRLVIADELAPRVQAHNARVADLPLGAWLAG